MTDWVLIFSIAILGCLACAFAFLVTALLISEMRTDPLALRHPIISIKSQISKRRRKKNASDTRSV